MATSPARGARPPASGPRSSRTRGSVPEEAHPESPQESPPESPEGSTAWERRRRLAEVFGDTLPETTSDERDEPAPKRADGETAGDAWLREQVPPHHGG